MVRGKLADWADAVKKRDNYTCQKCGSRDNPDAHHLDDSEELLYDIDNGVTLCRSCHLKLRSDGKLRTTICLKVSTVRALMKLGGFKDTYDSVIERLLRERK